jgi:hypothetical protein
VTRKLSERCSWKTICDEWPASHWIWLLSRCQQEAEGHLKKLISECTLPDMSNKQIVEDLLQRIPEDASLHDIAQEIEFIAAVRQGLSELDRGERIRIEEVERELPSWIIR